MEELKYITNKQLKNYVLNNCDYLIKQVNSACYHQYADYLAETEGVILPKSKYAPSGATLNELKAQYGAALVRGCILINGANGKRRQRLTERISKIYADSVNAGYTCYFITFDFNDDYLNNTKATYRRKYIQRWLKNHCRHYVANIDFGADENHTMREHYHAFVSSDSYNNMIHDYHQATNSGIHIEKLRVKSNMDSTCRRLGKYISKLTNHALKESAPDVYFIFDRNHEYVI